MPHKHKRRGNDNELYNLPPGVVAKPLPARDPNVKSKATGRTKREEKEKLVRKYESKNKTAVGDDTPRAFRRLMQFQTQSKPQQPSSKTDDGEGKKKRKREIVEGQSELARKKKAASTPATTTPAAAAAAATKSDSKTDSQPAPTILPGEKLSDFAARVDREMPLSAMKRSNQAAHAPDGTKIRERRLTKHDKRLRRLQSQWREEEEKIQEREAIEREEREEEMDEQLQLWKQWEAEAGKNKKKGAAQKKKKNKGKGAAGNDGDASDDGGDDTDPWAKLNKPERLNKPANHLEVAQAPPQLKKPREIFKVRGGAKVNVANVPAGVGSLRRREELANERNTIVEEYRRRMAEKRQ